MKLLAKTDLAAFLEALQPEFRVVAPVLEGTEIELVDLDKGRLAAGYAGRTRFSPKEHLFPESEVLFTFEVTPGGDVGSIDEQVSQVKTVLWGIRPCDVAGVGVLDSVFLSSPADPYYQARRDNTLFLTLNCNDVLKSCFCKSMGTGPFSGPEADVVFTDLGEDFLVEAGTEAGTALLEGQPDLFRDARPEDEAKALDLKRTAEASFTTSLDTEEVRANLAEAFDDPAWAEESSKCTLCGTCCIVCPACHCFNVEDIRKSRKVVQRVRYWDSCQFSGFTRMATSASRQTQGERWRQKIYDKFFYFPQNHGGQLGCTGCGRCLELCQGSINILEVMTKVIRGR